MRRSTSFAALVTTLALVATPVAAQTSTSTWFANALVGSAFGTPGTTPAANLMTGHELGQGVSIVGELGMFRHEPFENLHAIPGGPAVPANADQKANAWHLNANMRYQVPDIGRLAPYLTLGFGTYFAPAWQRSPIGSIPSYDHDATPTGNLGGGLTVRLTPWLGVSADYRYFAVGGRQFEHVNRFSTGISLLLR